MSRDSSLVTVQDDFEVLLDSDVHCLNRIPASIDDELESSSEEEFNGDNIVEPRVGLEFSNVDEAVYFYKTYASRLGFSVRKDSPGISKSGHSNQRLRCSKEGYSERQRKEKMGGETSAILRTPEKERSNTRTGCKAYVRFKRLKSGVWQLSKLNGHHNHALLESPSKKRNLRSSIRVTEEEKQAILDLRAQKMGISQIWNYLAEKVGGKSNMRFKKQDVCNIIAEQYKALVGIDVDTTLMHFRKKQEVDPDFYYAIEKDENGAAKNILWIDGRARRAYVQFGDVVTFDTTYNTNKYVMPLALFVGVNHHWQTIIFGCCLLRNEKAYNFSWLFTTWLAAMHNKAPQSIITDQDPAMKAAIQAIFPTTVHRCCQWHVMRKAREHLGVLYNKKQGFLQDLEAVVNRSMTAADFENGWAEMIAKYALKENKHLKTMFGHRSDWVPAYFRGKFFASMTTTQRSECVNAITKIWVDGHSTIYQFALQFEKVIEDIWVKESDEDCKTINTQSKLGSFFNIEVEAREVYTKALFKRFRERVKDSTAGFVIEVEKDTLYEVKITRHPHFTRWVPESHRVSVDKTNATFSCSCMRYEFEGLLCKHAIKVMLHVGVDTLPSKYILKRWTRGANEGTKGCTTNNSINDGKLTESQEMRLARVKDFVKMVSTSSSASRLFDEEFEKLREKVQPLINKESGQEDPDVSSGVDSTVAPQLDQEYRDPPLSKCKGRKRKLQRIKPSSEIGKKRRTCSYCHKKEGHNIRGCEKRIKDLAARKKKKQNQETVDEDDMEEDGGEEDDMEEDGDEEDGMEEDGSEDYDSEDDDDANE